MVHLPYLQPFEDVNKRVSRLAAVLVTGGPSTVQAYREAKSAKYFPDNWSNLERYQQPD